MGNRWEPDGYDRNFGFVTRLGADLVGMLAPAAGESVIDIGCGTGHLTAAVARSGAVTVGLDADAAMIDRARERYPDLVWVLGDAQELHSAAVPGAPFDAAISNAALHWMPNQDRVLAGVRGLLRSGGRFVAEMGGAGNVAAIDAALRGALEDIGLDVEVPGNFFPTVGVEAGLLERAGFRVDEVRWFERPTQLAAGESAADWTRHFRTSVWQQVPRRLAEDLAAAIDARAAAAGLARDAPGAGVSWSIDYRRLRFRATAR